MAKIASGPYQENFTLSDHITSDNRLFLIGKTASNTTNVSGKVFTQQDTWMGDNSDPQTLHKYLYSASDPINKIDPSGKNWTLSGLNQAQTIQAELLTLSVAAYSIGQELSQGWDKKTGPSSVQAGWLVLSAAMDKSWTHLIGQSLDDDKCFLHHEQ